MATESQFRAVIEAMAAAAEVDRPIQLLVFRGERGSVSYRSGLPEESMRFRTADEAISFLSRQAGIPIAPDPPAELPQDDASERRKFIDEALMALWKACPGAKHSWYEERLDELLAVRDRAFKAATPPKGD